jgi:hypothetical protein
MQQSAWNVQYCSVCIADRFCPILSAVNLKAEETQPLNADPQ